MTLFGVNTGIRISELLNQKWENVDFGHGYLTIEESKTGQYRKVKMNTVVSETLRSMQKEGIYVSRIRMANPTNESTKQMAVNKLGEMLKFCLIKWKRSLESEPIGTEELSRQAGEHS